MSPSVVSGPFIRLAVCDSHPPTFPVHNCANLTRYLLMLALLYFVFFFHFIHEASQICPLPSLLFFFPCKTRSSTHLLNHPSRFPPSTTTCRVRPWLVPKVSVISTIRLVLLRLFFSSLSLSSSSCPIVAWVGVSPSNLSSPLYSQLNDKMTKWRCFCCCSLEVCVQFHVRDECWHVFLRRG